MIIFINGKQKRVPRVPLIMGLTVEEFIERNVDPIWLHQNEMWELIPVDDNGLQSVSDGLRAGPRSESGSRSEEIPF